MRWNAICLVMMSLGIAGIGLSVGILWGEFNWKDCTIPAILVLLLFLCVFVASVGIYVEAAEERIEDKESEVVLTREDLEEFKESFKSMRESCLNISKNAANLMNSTIELSNATMEYIEEASPCSL